MGKVIGIDLGTTNSVVAILDGSQAEDHRKRSWCAHDPLGREQWATGDEWIIGEVAKRQLASRPESHHLLRQAPHGYALR